MCAFCIYWSLKQTKKKNTQIKSLDISDSNGHSKIMLQKMPLPSLENHAVAFSFLFRCVVSVEVCLVLTVHRCVSLVHQVPILHLKSGKGPPPGPPSSILEPISRPPGVVVGLFLVLMFVFCLALKHSRHISSCDTIKTVQARNAVMKCEHSVR